MRSSLDPSAHEVPRLGGASCLLRIVVYLVKIPPFGARLDIDPFLSSEKLSQEVKIPKCFCGRTSPGPVMSISEHFTRWNAHNM